jgi:hypothetical protein
MFPIIVLVARNGAEAALASLERASGLDPREASELTGRLVTLAVTPGPDW